MFDMYLVMCYVTINESLFLSLLAISQLYLGLIHINTINITTVIQRNSSCKEIQG